MNLKAKREALVSSLVMEGWLRTMRVIDAFKKIPREEFVPAKYKEYAYADQPLPIGKGQTISAPGIVALMTELLEPRKTDKVLEIGSGSGYQAAILGTLVKAVYSLELDPELAELARQNLKRTGIKNVKVIVKDGSMGYEKEKPYDRIIITCACPDFPGKLIEQLKPKGKIIAPLGGHFHQTLTLGIKSKKTLERKYYGGCIFVPLRH